MPSDRGEYRPVFCRILNGPAFLTLPPIARACFWPLKLRLSAIGLGVIPALAAVLAEDTGFTQPEIETALKALESPFEGPSEGGLPWIRRQGNVVWLVRGLEFEPTLNVEDPKHRKHVARLVDALPSVPLIHAFKSHYAKWFPEALQSGDDVPAGAAHEGPRSPFEAPSKPLRSTTPTPTPTPNTTTTTAHARPPTVGSPAHLALAGRMTQDRYRSALEGYLRASHDPPRLLQHFELMVDGLAGPGGRPVDPDVLGAALNAMAIAGAKPTEKIVAAFALREIEPSKSPNGNGKHGTDAKMAGTLATMERFRQRHGVPHA